MEIYGTCPLFFSNLIPECIEQFSKSTHSYPSDTTDEEWQEYLLKIARLLRESVEDNPELDEKLEDLLDEFDISGDSVVYRESYDEYLKECEEYAKIRSRKRRVAFEMLAERFENLWD